MQKLMYETVPLSVGSSGATVESNFELDDRIESILGFQIVSTDDKQAALRGSIQILINSEEVIKKETPARLFISSVTNEPEKRFTKLAVDENNQPVGIKSVDRKIFISYKDTNNTLAAFSAYTVNVLLLCKRKS